MMMNLSKYRYSLKFCSVDVIFIFVLKSFSVIIDTIVIISTIMVEEVILAHVYAYHVPSKVLST